MPVPSLITDLSTTPASNSPAGSENVFPSLDDYLRAQSAFLASVRDNSGNGWVSPYLPLSGGTMTGTVNGLQMASANGGQLAGLRNKIINGDMRVAQRGTTAVTTGATYGPADRWVTGTAGNTFSTTQGSFASGDTLFDTGGAQFFTQIAVTSVAGASNSTDFSQKIEDVRLLAGQTVTVSFWAKAASGTPSIGVEVRQNFGNGGSTTVTGTGQAQALTTTWAQYTKTFTVPSINGKTVGTANTHFTQLVFWLDAGSTLNTVSGSIGQASKTVSIAQVQVEVGPVATPFEQRPYGMELALCQRYFQIIKSLRFAGYQFAGSEMAAPVGLMTAMRGDPTAVVSNFTTVNVTGPTVFATNMSTGGGSIRIIALATGLVSAIDGQFALSSEL
jgi:hypothetical protein